MLLRRLLNKKTHLNLFLKFTRSKIELFSDKQFNKEAVIGGPNTLGYRSYNFVFSFALARQIIEAEIELISAWKNNSYLKRYS